MDLVPRETKFKLSIHPDKEFTLSRWSLLVRTWATKKYTSTGLQQAFNTVDILIIADLAWFMSKDKEFFGNSQDKFLDSITSMRDHVSIIEALLGAIGIGEPEIEKVRAALPYDDQKKSEVVTTTENP